MPPLNIPNLDKLIAHLEAQPPESVNMAYVEVQERDCGTCGCIIGHAQLLWPDQIRFGYEAEVSRLIGLLDQIYELTRPDGWADEENGALRYPAHRVIATLKRLRDRFLATGEIVVDWGPEPSSGEPWAAPQAIELTPPALPAEITRLLSLAPATETSGA